MTADIPRDAEQGELAALVRWREDASCPPPDLLLPALEHTLHPESIAAAIRAHVGDCGACRELAEALEEAAAQLTPAERVRVDRRIAWRRRRVASWAGMMAAAAMVVAIAGAAYLAQRSAPPLVPAPAPLPTTAPAPQPVPVAFALPLEAPPIDLPAEALTLRSGGGDPYAAALEHALEPFAAAEYAETMVRLEPLASEYPQRPHPFFYLGVSRLLAGAAEDAVAPLARARELAAPRSWLAHQATWYLAVAFERSGRQASAMAPLTDLCGARGPLRQQACDSLRHLQDR